MTTPGQQSFGEQSAGRRGERPSRYPSGPTPEQAEAWREQLDKIGQQFQYTLSRLPEVVSGRGGERIVKALQASVDSFEAAITGSTDSKPEDPLRPLDPDAEGLIANELNGIDFGTENRTNGSVHSPFSGD